MMRRRTGKKRTAKKKPLLRPGAYRFEFWNARTGKQIWSIDLELEHGDSAQNFLHAACAPLLEKLVDLGLVKEEVHDTGEFCPHGRFATSPCPECDKEIPF